MIGPRPELDEELDELELLDEEELELLDELELDEELELELELEEVDVLPLLDELELLELELVAVPTGSALQPARPVTKLVANKATGKKRVSGSCRNTTEAFMKSSWGYF